MSRVWGFTRADSNFYIQGGVSMLVQQLQTVQHEEEEEDEKII